MASAGVSEWVDKKVKLYPDVVNKPLVTIDATCHIVKETDGKVRAYTSIRSVAGVGCFFCVWACYT